MLQHTVLEQHLGEHYFELFVLPFQLLIFARSIQIHLPKLQFLAMETDFEMLCVRQTSAAYASVLLAEDVDLAFGRATLAFLILGLFDHPGLTHRSTRESEAMSPEPS